MKKYTALLQIVIVGSLLAVTFQYVLASRPATPPSDNGKGLIHEDTTTGGPTNEFKAGGLKVGDGSTTPNIVEPGYELDVRGSIYSTGLSVIKSGGTGGQMYVVGNITNDALSATGTANVCANSTGTLIRC